jgi:hypothetical protein
LNTSFLKKIYSIYKVISFKIKSIQKNICSKYENIVITIAVSLLFRGKDWLFNRWDTFENKRALFSKIKTSDKISGIFLGKFAQRV